MTDQTDLRNRILLLETDEDVIRPLEVYFREQGMEFLVAGEAEAGLHQAVRARPDVILLASSLGQVDGLDLYQALRASPLTAHIPIMFITAQRDSARQNELLAAGADDVIVRPFDVEILALRVRNAIQRSRREGLTDSRTGLPTGALITERLRDLERGGAVARLELSIANFEAFRARYNFISGNDVLRYAATEICEVVEQVAPGDFVGHRDEARFVVLTAPERQTAVQEALKARLDEGLLQFYSFMEREQGFIQVEDSAGELVDRPLMHLEVESQQ